MPSEPVLRRDANGAADYDSVPDVIEWFLNCDQRVATVRHPKVEELFQWKQNQSRLADENVFIFDCAEDRFAIGIIQALAHNPTERELHTWIAQLINALETASKATEDVTSAYQLEMTTATSVISEYAKIPGSSQQTGFLLN